MNPANLSLPDWIGALVGFIFTLLVFSYLFGDNPLFRLAIHIFIGVAAGYAAVVVWYNVIWPQLLLPLIDGTPSERLFLAFPLVLSVLLLFKASPRFSRLGNLSIAFLVGVSVATIIGGAVLGTVFTQVSASINLFDMGLARSAGISPWLFLLQSGVVLFGTLTTLIYFHFGAPARPAGPTQRREWIESLAWFGKLFIAIAFGMLFAGVYSTALAALIERVLSLGDFLLPFVLPQ